MGSLSASRRRSFGLLPQEAFTMIAEKHKLSFFFFFCKENKQLAITVKPVQKKALCPADCAL